ncbi:MAG: glycogen-debranching protein, partial [Planctomycetes bacterium]|nr:glycogen-debranching protein [Planctomycetota bacterium]
MVCSTRRFSFPTAAVCLSLVFAACLPAVAAPWGAQATSGGLTVRVYSEHATRIELCLFARRMGESERLRLPMQRGANNAWELQVSSAQLQAANLPEKPFYGFRAWGPNWPYDASWTPGTEVGFQADVDAAGNRFNPNKVLFDPYAKELTHDPINPRFSDGPAFASGPKRAFDTAQVAPKGVILGEGGGSSGPSRPFKDEVVYEVHLRGFTKNDPSVPADERGTYAGAARKADYLRQLGITAVEFLPLHETDNDQNDIAQGTQGDNYWGYANLSFFAPDRRYAKDKTPGGPTRELQAMVRAFHAKGIKVILDVVYNHTGEGYLWGGKPD